MKHKINLVWPNCGITICANMYIYAMHLRCEHVYCKLSCVHALSTWTVNVLCMPAGQLSVFDLMLGKCREKILHGSSRIRTPSVIAKSPVNLQSPPPFDF